jgi:predicted helicase
MGEGRGGGLATIHHAHLYGERSGKYRFLERNSAGSIQWTQLQPTKPSYLFIPQNNDLRGEYEQGWNITEAFPINNIAMQTHRDYFVTDLDTQELRNRITAFRETRMTNEEARSKFDLGSWDVAKARKKLRSDENWQKGFTQCLWRPFDIRPLYYHRELIDRPRPQVTEALLEPNFGLLAMRQIALQGGCSHFLVANIPPVDRVFYSNKGAASVFPLYLYTTPDDTAGTLFAQTETTRTPNLAPEFIKAFSGKLGLAFVPDGQGDLKKTFGPEDIFNYAYAIFHSPTYRQRYAEFLKIDFPRLPLTSDKKLFAKLAAKGAELVSLHLLKTSTLNSFITTFPISGSNSVDKVRYDASRKKVWINDEQYFGGLPEKVWEFQVGGYQVCEKWLKDRKGRTLSTDDIRHYQRVVVALKETIRLMAEIDKVIPGWPIL